MFSLEAPIKGRVVRSLRVEDSSPPDEGGVYQHRLPKAEILLNCKSHSSRTIAGWRVDGNSRNKYVLTGAIIDDDHEDDHMRVFVIDAATQLKLALLDVEKFGNSSELRRTGDRTLV